MSNVADPTSTGNPVQIHQPLRKNTVMKRSVLLALIIGILSALCVAGIITALLATQGTENEEETNVAKDVSETSEELTTKQGINENSVEVQQPGKLRLI